MSRRIIQVPMDEALLDALDALSRKEERSRADLIREACRRYLSWLESEELDRAYQEGYLRFPEEPALAELQATLAAQVLSKETW